MRDRPLCKHGDHDDGSSWCEDAKKALVARLGLILVKRGADFETHGGKKVIYTGRTDDWWDDVPQGTVGVIDHTMRDYVTVRWQNCTSRAGEPNPCYQHPWSDLEVLLTDEEGGVSPEEMKRALLHTAEAKKRLLLSCPFCGNRDMGTLTDEGARFVHCINGCGGCGPAISGQFPEEYAFIVWNIRGVPGGPLSNESRGRPKTIPDGIERRETVDAGKPCPFCLGQKLAITYCPKSKLYHGRCEGCGAFAPTWFHEPHPKDSFEKSPEGVVRGWCRRKT